MKILDAIAPPELPPALVAALFEAPGALASGPGPWKLAEQVAAALQCVLGSVTCPRLRRASDGVELNHGVVGVTLSVGMSNMTIALDLKLARALVDLLAGNRGGLRGYGPLSAAEEGVLEFILLEVIDRLCANCPEAAGLTLSAIEWEEGLRRRLMCSSHQGWVYFATVGCTTGLVAVWLPEQEVPVERPFARHIRPAGERLGVLGALTLRGIASRELESLGVGDLLTLGRTALDGAGWVLLTDSGWQLAECSLQQDAPGALRMSLGDVRPAGLHWMQADTAALVCFGESELSEGELARLPACVAIELRRPAGSVARLLRRDGSILSGELVRATGELALKILPELPSNG